MWGWRWLPRASPWFSASNPPKHLSLVIGHCSLVIPGIFKQYRFLNEK
jgi:hypothetical protein